MKENYDYVGASNRDSRKRPYPRKAAMSLMDKITSFITVVLIFVGLPALFLYGAYRQLAEGKLVSGMVLLLIGGGLAWAAYQFMYCVGPHPKSFC